MTKALLVFAKAPEPGESKTRLIPALGANKAAAAHEMLALRTLDATVGLVERAMRSRCGVRSRIPCWIGGLNGLVCLCTCRRSGTWGRRCSRVLHRC